MTTTSCGADNFSDRAEQAAGQTETELRELATSMDLTVAEVTVTPALQEAAPFD